MIEIKGYFKMEEGRLIELKRYLSAVLRAHPGVSLVYPPSEEERAGIEEMIKYIDEARERSYEKYRRVHRSINYTGKRRGRKRKTEIPVPAAELGTGNIVRFDNHV
jgi:hypothetical protein